MEVVGQINNGEEAVNLTRLLYPDVLLMALHLPEKGRDRGGGRAYRLLTWHSNSCSDDIG